MTLTQGHISKVEVPVHTYPKSVAGNNSLLPCWIWKVFHKMVVLGPRVCHDLDKIVVHSPMVCYNSNRDFYEDNLDPMSYFKGQGRRVHINKKACLVESG